MSGILKALLLLVASVQAAAQVAASNAAAAASTTAIPAKATVASETVAEAAVNDEEQDADENDEDEDDVFSEDVTALLKEHDTDKDGKLTMQEIVNASGEALEDVKKAFTTADVNVDTFIDSVEMPKLMKAMQGADALLQEQDEEGEEDDEADEDEEAEVSKAVQADADEDGKLTMQEVVDASGEDLAIVTKAFETADVNADTFVDSDELPKLMKALQGEEALLQEEEGEQDDETDEDEETEVSKAAQADTDKDGKLTMQEVVDASGEDLAIVTKAFETADVNADTFVDSDELPKLMAALMDTQEM